MTGLALLASEEPLSATTVAWFLVAAVVLIALNGFFVAYEFAILAARRSSFTSEDRAGRRTSQATLTAMSDLSMQLAGAQLGITMASLALGYVAEPAFEVIFETLLGSTFSPEVTRGVSIAAALSLAVFLHLVVGEMFPKNVALAAPDATMRWLVLPYRLYLILLRPLVVSLNALSNWGCRLVGVEVTDELVAVHTVSELTAIVNRSRAEGVIEGGDAELLSGALRFAQLPVGEIAVPLARLDTLRVGSTAAQAERLAATTGKDRIAITGSNPDRPLVGYLHARDLFALDPAAHRAPLPVGLIRDMATVRAERSLVQVLRTMRRVNRQVALVEDDRGPVGLVTIEDVVRALMERAEDVPLEPHGS